MNASNVIDLVNRIDTSTEAAKQILSMRKLSAHGMADSDDEVTLSPDQEKALAQIGEWLLESGRTCFSLVGPAGSGKTTLMREAIALARKRNWVIALSAPTHQAAARLKDATGRHADTTHRLLGAKLIRDKKTGKESLKAGTPTIEPDTFVIIDEASMLPSKLLDIVMDFAKNYDCKILFVGDRAQLNPVKELPSITVDLDNCPWGYAELKTIHRQAAENPIIAAATKVRLAEPREHVRFETSLKDGNGIECYTDKRAWADAMLEYCARDDESNRYVAYTNKATDEAAKAVRREHYGEQADVPYIPGEKLVVNSRVVLDDGEKPKKGKAKSKQRCIQSNDTVTVISAYRSGELYHVECDWHGETVNLKAFENYNLREECLKKLAISAADQKDWTTFFETSDSIADLRSAVSMTAHSSQGSTFDDVFINLDQISRCYNLEERQRLLYVAITRASRKVHLTGELR